MRATTFQVFSILIRRESEPTPARHKMPWIAALLFLGLALWVSGAHEIWRDEAQAWMIALESRNLGELWVNTRQEGHPPLWHFLLWPLTQMHLPLFSMHALQSALGAIGVYTVFRFSPFSLLEKVGICFGYFFFYEWTIIARNYLGGIVFLFVALCHWEKRSHPDWQKSLWFYLPLGVSAAFNIFNLGIAFALGVSLGLQTLSSKHWKNFVGLSVLGCAGVFSAYSIVRANVGMQSYGSFKIGEFGWHSFDRAFRHFADFYIVKNIEWWSHFKIEGGSFRILKAISFLGTLAFFVSVLKKHRLALAFFLGLSACYAILFGIKDGGARHSAFVWVCAVTGFWLALADPEHREAVAKRLSFRFARWAFLVGLCTQLVFSFKAARTDLHKPFSSSREAADLIAKHAQEHGYKTYSLAGVADWASTPVAAYLNKPVFSPYRMQEELFVRWAERKHLSSAEALLALAAHLSQSTQPTYLILNESTSVPEQFTLVGRAESGTVDSERYSIFLSSPQGNSKP